MKLKMKFGAKVIGGAVAFAILLSLSGCQEVAVATEEKIKPVEAIALKAEKRESTMQYYGYVMPEMIKKFSFSTGGTLETITLKAGDIIKTGDILASVKPDKLNIAVRTANEQQSAAALQVEKAKTGLDFLQKAVADAKGLIETGAMTSQQFDEIVLNRDIALKDYELAMAQAAQAKLQGQYQQKNKSDAILYSDIDGVVAQVLYETGELIAPGYPVIVVKSLNHIVSVGMIAEDLSGLKIGDEATAKSGQKSWKAKITEIAVLPDEKTRTYQVKYALSGEAIPYVGELLSIEIAKDALEGIWLPINAIKNDGVDYVYVVEEGRAIRKNITLGETVKDEVVVEGLAAGDLIITKGATSISHGYKVKIQEGAK